MNSTNSIKFLKYRTLILAALLLAVGIGKLNSQPSVTIAQELCCENTSVLTSVDVLGYEDVSSFTFFIQIDTLLVNYVAIENMHALLGNNLVVNFQTFQSRIAISWFSLAGITIEEGTLFDLKLNYHQGNAALNFEACEISDSEGNILENVTYENGSLLPSLEIVAQPQLQSIIQGEQMQFNIVLQNAGDQEFNWQEFNGLEWSDISNDAPYSGAFTSVLSINNVPPEFNDFQYRCKITYSNCSVFSDAATLKVLPLTVPNNFETGTNTISIFPNPFTSYFNYQIKSTVVDNIFRLYNISGEPVSEHFSQSSSGIINTENLESGMYFLQITNSEFTTNVKLLKK
jgi:hypothetical protein